MANTYQYDVEAPDGTIYTIEAPEENSVIPQSDGLKEYKNENIGDVFNNIFVRPGAAVRSAIKGKGFQEGFADPNSTKTFSQSMLDKFGGTNTYINFALANAGSIADIATNPADLLGMLVGKAPVGGTGTTLESMIASSKAGQAVSEFASANRSAKLLGREVTPGSVERLGSIKASSEARKSVKQLLPSGEYPTAIQSEGVNLIKKTSEPKDILNKFSLEKYRVISEVNRLVNENNKPVDPRFVTARAKLILEKQIKNSTPADRIKINKAIKDEIGFITEQDVFDTKAANARKRFLYEETQGLQKSQMQGKTIVVKPESQIVKDAFAQAYKESIEAVHPDIGKLNSRFNGLLEGEKAAEKLVNVSPLQKSQSVTTIEGRPTKTGLLSAISKKVYDPYSVKSLTSKIEKLSNKGSDLLNKSRLAQAPNLLDKFITKAPNKKYFQSLLKPEDITTLIQNKSKGEPRRFNG